MNKMCMTSKCCWFVNLDRGCLFIGYGSLLFTAALSCVSIAPLAIDDQRISNNDTGTLGQFGEYFNMHLRRLPMKTILVVTAVVGVSGVAASITLILGLVTNKSGLVLCYFGYGIIFVIVTLVGALLELLQSFMITAIVQMLACSIHIHFLVVVYTAYEAMQRGKLFGSSGHHTIDEEILIDEN